MYEATAVVRVVRFDTAGVISALHEEVEREVLEGKAHETCSVVPAGGYYCTLRQCRPCGFSWRSIFNMPCFRANCVGFR